MAKQTITEEQLQEWEKVINSKNSAVWQRMRIYKESFPLLIAEVRMLQAEIKRVAVFLAIHGVDGYEFVERDE